MLRIGLVMLQGARHVHMSALQRAAEECGIEISLHELRMASDLVDADLHAMVLPGGESTTMRLTGNHETSGLLPAVFDWIRSDPSRPVLGTCAGAILLSDPQDGDDWQGATGYINVVLDKYFNESLDADVYLAGPPIMIRFTRKVLDAKGVNSNQIHRDPIRVRE